jgi:hypothetical protein
MSFAGNSSPRFNNRNSLTEVNLNNFNTLNGEINRGMNINLTSCVWPKSRTLLSIISKMYSEKYITADQRSILKEMIIDRDKTLIMFLNDYEVSGDSLKMYEKIIQLSEQKLQIIRE